ncbi:unnamed protein product [Rotaria sordida]|uniref:Uncharacterized protein n=1 Tax=Rotaria sordida TaxID=392033 RepID=A0A814FNM3_9BILA|nr:unnamed protein product [Rotaria sordida]CAF0982604.1 unnamed protein product [Rotaria sordida]
MNIKSNTRNINNYPNHIPVSRKPSSSTTTSFIHLRPHVNAKFNLCNATQRKHAPYYRKFQTGSTTTFSGYTNISNENRNSRLKQNIQNNYIHSNSKFNKNTTENNPIPSLMSIYCFQQPPRKNRRSIQHAEQYKDRAPLIQPNYANKNDNFTPTSNELQGIILSDSMCKYVRSEQVKQMQTEKNKKIFEMDFLVFSLCTNDVANLGPELAIQKCHDLIQYVRRLFPKLKSIGWLALSPRWKPSKLFDSSQMNENNEKFNQLLKILSKQLNFEVIHTNLQHHHMHTDGLHPSIKSGHYQQQRTKYQEQQKQQLQIYEDNNQQHCQQQKQRQKQKMQIKYHHKQYETKQYQEYQRNNVTVDNNNQYRWSVNQKYETQHLPIKKLIPNYPHFLRHKEEFFRKIAIPVEFEKEKEKIFILSNLHFQTEFLKLEADKWRIYIESANDKKQITQERKQIETIVIDDNSIPIARPSPNGFANPPAPLDFSDLSELFDEWLPEPVPGKKRKLGQRQDNPPTPPSPRQPPPPIILRKTLPPRNKDAPLQGGSVQSSPFYDNDKREKNKNEEQHQQSYNVLLPLEKQIENNNENRNEIRQTTIINIDKDSSMIISPIKSSTPEPRIRSSPSVIPKDSIARMPKKFEFIIMPIECRYYFKRTKQRCTIETIKEHQNFLENKYEELEHERENKLHSFFSEKEKSQVISFVKNTIEKVLENKKKNDQKRLDNLLLDHKREKATQIIKNTATQSEQQLIQCLHKKYMRTLELKLQLDKLEMRFIENMPPPSLNIIDKLQLYAKELEPNDNQLNSLREQWKNVLRKAKLDLTALMRQAKIVKNQKPINEKSKTHSQPVLKSVT